jgi:hypothetical protein
LVHRHDDSGKPPEQAREWVNRVDQPNADLVDAAAGRADIVLDVTRWRGRLMPPQEGCGS